jgi:hypothetical protein
VEVEGMTKKMKKMEEEKQNEVKEKRTKEGER